MIKKLALILATVALVAFGSAAPANATAGHHHHRHGHHHLTHKQRLKLCAEVYMDDNGIRYCGQWSHITVA